MKAFRMPIVATAAIAMLCFLLPASAAVTGHLDTANCSGNGVIVTATLIDWEPAGGGTGCIVTGSNTSITYTTGTLGPGVTGTIKDLPAGSNLDFMTFTGNPNLHFDLTSIGPGPISTVCSTTLNPNNPACAVSAGSAFILTPTSTGTSVTLSATGIARDLSGSNSTWVGAFTTQISGRTPAQIQANIIAGGSERSTHSGDFTLTFVGVPEPGTTALIGCGLLLVGVFGRKLRKV